MLEECKYVKFSLHEKAIATRRLTYANAKMLALKYSMRPPSH